MVNEFDTFHITRCYVHYDIARTAYVYVLDVFDKLVILSLNIVIVWEYSFF